MKECCTNRVLELLHMDLMGPMQTESLGGKKYVFVVVDNVPLAILLKKGLFSNVEPSVADVLVTMAHSEESSLTSVRFGSLVDDQCSVPDTDPVGDSTGNLGENIADPTNENPDENVDAHGEPIDNCAPGNIEPNVDVPQTETQQRPGESRPKEKKYQQNQQNITTKNGRKKVPPNILSVFIDGISFHLKETVQR
ncbi:gag-pol polyprotein [Cucumis melo var. makuwa]|uniref:Gag-pol polyprotein n=1 Tax=Cucumis melo var. makuwa TaxID=1194695 RepID=A0A5A7SIU7_CUCMM|nr:gag-pol polyprotein [Cucumis melo var. makuwa]TYJ96301.1 gag-pol polyprotein [Cucumis melo var. makuwa]